MDSPQILGLLGVIGIFLLRFGVPLLISAGITWWLYRLDLKWRTEAPKIASVSSAVATTTIPLQNRIIAEPCWVYRACPEETRNKCPAYTQPDVACWLARLRNDGRLPGRCRCCSIFATSHTTAAAD